MIDASCIPRLQTDKDGCEQASSVCCAPRLSTRFVCLHGFPAKRAARQHPSINVSSTTFSGNQPCYTSQTCVYVLRHINSSGYLHVRDLRGRKSHNVPPLSTAEVTDIHDPDRKHQLYSTTPSHSPPNHHRCRSSTDHGPQRDPPGHPLALHILLRPRECGARLHRSFSDVHEQLLD